RNKGQKKGCPFGQPLPCYLCIDPLRSYFFLCFWFVGFFIGFAGVRLKTIGFIGSCFPARPSFFAGSLACTAFRFCFCFAHYNHSITATMMYSLSHQGSE